MKTRSILSLLALLFLTSPAEARRDVSETESFAADADAFIGTALELLPEVPGLAMAVVVDDRVVLARGFGLADVENGVPASAQTVYYIASATKPFTALAAARLHERGDIDLDSSLAQHLAGSGMDPALVADGVTLRDLLSHTAGLRNAPITFRLAYTGEHSPDLLWRLLSATEPNEAGPGRFEYTNFGYNLLTIILDRELGKTWQNVLRDEIFIPAGLASTTSYASLPIAEGWPLAAPYFGMHPDGMQRVSLVKIDATMQSAGGVMTTAEDAARWMLLQINGGVLDGRRIVGQDAVLATQRSRVETEGDKRGLFGTDGCGLGWRRGRYAGQTVLHHTGGYPGFCSLISFMPEARLGVAVFVNEGSIGGMVPEALAAWAYDWWLEQDTANAAELITGIAARRDRFREHMKAEFAKRAARKWNLERERAEYAGRYADPGYGTLVISTTGDEIHVKLGRLGCIAEPYTKPNAIRVELVPGQGEVIIFTLDEDATVDGLEYDGTRFEKLR